MKHFATAIGLGFSALTFASAAADASTSLTLYFDNDSVNGFKYSDAYETHNMGVVYAEGKSWFKLDAGLVGPKMPEHMYPEWTPNRAFGEVLTFEMGRQLAQGTYYLRLRQIGTFGLDFLQNQLHTFFGFGSTQAELDSVRMPSASHIGLGIRTAPPLYFGWQPRAHVYFGTDELSAGAGVARDFQTGLYDWTIYAGNDYVATDVLVTAPPVHAPLRSWRPNASVRLARDFGKYRLTLGHDVSLPKTDADDIIYIRLHAGLSFPL